MGNLFGTRSDAALEALGTSAGAKLSTAYAQYGIDKELADSIASLSLGFHGLLGSAKTQHDLAKQATVSKDAGRDALLGALAQASAVLYAPQSTVTDAQLAAIGFAPRRSGSVQPKAAQRVTDVAAAPSADGSVKLSWSRGGNPKSAVFQVEASADAGATWTMVGSTTRASLTLDGFAPGAAAWLRVVATTAKTASAPSSAMAIYGPQPAPAFRLKVA